MWQTACEMMKLCRNLFILIGSVKFYYGKSEEVSEFIGMCAKKWNAQNENTLHCMFATNQLVAEYSGFSKVYEVFKRAEVYQGIGYKQLNTELLSHDTVHLGKSQSLLFRLMKLYTEVRDERQPLRDIFPTDKYRDMSFHDLKLLITSLKSLDGNTLDELLIAIFNEYDTSNNQMYKLIIERIFDADEEVSYDGVLRFFLTSLYKTWDETLETKLIIQELLNMKIVELLNWFHYVHRNEKKKICYHTFHSTKGLEYENVAIILGKDFGQDKGLFKNYFMNYEENEEQVSDKYERGRNILYVAVTRAIKNLRVLYIDDFKEVKGGMEKVFKKAYAFTDEIAIDDF
jgi:DNA helicase-2/ATP-dependent DNA helicase PcrA